MRQFCSGFSTNNWPTVADKYDVVVIGAGPAGLGAAIAAARAGAKTLVVERYGFPGGAGTVAAMAFFMGFAVDSRQVVAGVADELVRMLDTMGNARFRVKPGNTIDPQPIGGRPLLADVLTSVDGLRVAYNRLFERAGVTRFYYTSLLGAETEGSRLTAIIIDNADGIGRVSANAFVDATGDANLIWRAGGTVRETPVAQAMTKTILFCLGGVRDYDNTAVAQRFLELHAAGRCPLPEQNTYMAIPTLNPGEVQINFTLTGGNAVIAGDMTRMDIELREQVVVAVRWFRENFAEFKDAYLVGTASGVGVRAGRCAVGLDTISIRDINDNIATNRPVALTWRHWGGHGLRSFEDGGTAYHNGVFAISMGTLVPQGFDNMTVGGRAISAEPLAISTCRLMATCMATGQAAGTLAALAVREGVSVPDIEYPLLRRTLIKQSTILE